MRWGSTAGLCALAFVTFGGAAASAQGAAVGASCELHVWPAAGLDSMYYGWTHGSTVNGSTKGRKGYPLLPNDPLSVPVQRAALADVPVAALLGLPDATVVIHEQPLDRHDLRADAPRHAPSTAACYDELIVSKAFYEDAVYSNRSLRVLYAFRAFGPAATPPRTFMTWAEIELLAFPPKTEAEMAPALADLVRAFKASVRNFAGLLGAHDRAAGKAAK